MTEEFKNAGLLAKDIEEIQKKIKDGTLSVSADGLTFQINSGGAVSAGYKGIIPTVALEEYYKNHFGGENKLSNAGGYIGSTGCYPEVATLDYKHNEDEPIGKEVVTYPGVFCEKKPHSMGVDVSHGSTVLAEQSTSPVEQLKDDLRDLYVCTTAAISDDQFLANMMDENFRTVTRNSDWRQLVDEKIRATPELSHLNPEEVSEKIKKFFERVGEEFKEVLAKYKIEWATAANDQQLLDTIVLDVKENIIKKASETEKYATPFNTAMGWVLSHPLGSFVEEMKVEGWDVALTGDVPHDPKLIYAEDQKTPSYVVLKNGSEFLYVLSRTPGMFGSLEQCVQTLKTIEDEIAETMVGMDCRPPRQIEITYPLELLLANFVSGSYSLVAMSTANASYWFRH